MYERMFNMLNNNNSPSKLFYYFKPYKTYFFAIFLLSTHTEQSKLIWRCMRSNLDKIFCSVAFYFCHHAMILLFLSLDRPMCDKLDFFNGCS